MILSSYIFVYGAVHGLFIAQVFILGGAGAKDRRFGQSVKSVMARITCLS